MTILGIETSCDETAAAVVNAYTDKKRVRVLSNIFPSSMALHAKTGGIIPEIAAREQVKYIIPVIRRALEDAKIANPQKELHAIAVTVGPGLIGSLLVGVETAKSLALAWNKPLIPVNHLFGHIYANWLLPSKDTDKLQQIIFPALALVVSGGHTDLVLIKKHQKIQWLGGTRDDAAGEAFDKIGRMLGFPYPAGPTIENAAKKGNPKAYRFPRPLLHDKAFDFSFSGLKTAVLREIQKKNLSEKMICDISRGVQDAIIEVLVRKSMNAAKEYNASCLLLAGGVAANHTLRNAFEEKIKKSNTPLTLVAPEKSYCTDNAAMIASAAFYNHREEPFENVTADPELYFD